MVNEKLKKKKKIEWTPFDWPVLISHDQLTFLDVQKKVKALIDPEQWTTLNTKTCCISQLLLSFYWRYLRNHVGLYPTVRY